MSVVRHERFTATGGPKPPYKAPSAWEKSCPYGVQAPLLPPFQFSDESIIAVIVRLGDPNPDVNEKIEAQKAARHPKIYRLSRRVRHGLHNVSVAIGTTMPNIKCVFMPRREYLKNFAQDAHGNYIGSEPQRSWSEEELEKAFGKYRYAKRGKWVLSREESEEFMEQGEGWKGGQ